MGKKKSSKAKQSYLPLAGSQRAAGPQRVPGMQSLAYYEAARPTISRKARREAGSGDTAVIRAGVSLREQVRHLEQNHDITRGAIAIMVQNIVGPFGIGIEPQPRTIGGEIDNDLSSEILELWRDWAKRPEVTWEHNWAATQRIACRSWIRDGEVFSQIIEGTVPFLNHGTNVPLSLELIESDLVPLDYHGPGITAGVERNAWGRPVAYHLYRVHPGDIWSIGAITAMQSLKRIPADRMLHLKLVDRIRQARGVSAFASAIARFDDIRDYEESERVAAKVAASMAAAIIKGAPDDYDPDNNEVDDAGNPLPRELKFRAGMIFDDLLPGESIQTIDAKRPNPNMDPFLRAQVRFAAAGIGCTYSSLAKDYDGTYSAQRQELVEGWDAYAVLSSEFTSKYVLPVYERFIRTAITAGLLRVPAGIDERTLDDALFIFRRMPWIDPAKEVEAWEKMQRSSYASGPEIIRSRGQNPREVLEQESTWRRMAADKRVVIEADPANDGGAAPAPTGDQGNATEPNARTRTRLR